MVKSYRPASAGMLPAQPGTYLVTAYFDDGQVELVKCNVLGWSISSGRTVVPLVLDPRMADEEPWHVIYPDGRVECSDGHGWDNLDCWIRHERRHRRIAGGQPAMDSSADEDEAIEVYRPPVPQGMPEPHPEPQPRPQPQPVSAFQPSAAYAAQVR